MKNNEKFQILICGAGMCPLSLRLIEEYPNNISHIFEIDQEKMIIKNTLYEKILKTKDFPISFIQANIDKDDFYSKIIKNPHYNKNIPLIILIEGLSYYIYKETLLNIVSFPNPKTLFIIEYLRNPLSNFTPYINIGKNAFDFIKETFSLSFISQYSFEELSQMIIKNNPNSQLLKKTMHNYERSTLKKEKYFSKEKLSWIEFLYSSY